MASWYVVVQYENLMTGEALNIGVYTGGDGRVRFRGVPDLARIMAAFGKDLMLDWWLNDQGPSVVTDAQLDEQMARSGPYVSLKFVPKRASLLDPDALLADVSTTFLSFPSGP